MQDAVHRELREEPAAREQIQASSAELYPTCCCLSSNGMRTAMSKWTRGDRHRRALLEDPKRMEYPRRLHQEGRWQLDP